MKFSKLLLPLLSLLLLLPLLSFPLAQSDITPPYSEVTLSGTLGLNGWYISPVTVTITSDDLESGVAVINWQIDGGEWQQQSFSGTLNLARNPSFEISGTPLANWDFFGTPDALGAQDGTVAKFEVNSARVSASGGWGMFSNVSSFIPAAELDNYTASVWIRPTAVSGTGTYFRVFALTPSGPSLVVESNKILGTSDFVRLGQSFTTPLGTTGIYLELRLDGAGTVNFDGVSVNESLSDTWVSFVVGSQGNHTVLYYARDNAGNQEPTKSIGFKIDVVPPRPWFNFEITQEGIGPPAPNDHTFILKVKVRELVSGGDVSTAEFQYFVKAEPTWGYHTDLENCATPWIANGWYSASTIPPTDGPATFQLITPPVDFCDSNWAAVKYIRFRFCDLAGNCSQSIDYSINGGWMDLRNGDLYAAANINMPANSSVDGAVISSGLVQNFSSDKDWVLENYPVIEKPTYAQWYGKFPTTTPLPGGRLPLVSGRYLVSGNFVIDNPTIPSGYSNQAGIAAVIFVNGDLIVNTDLTTHPTTTLLFIVSGDLLIHRNVRRLDASLHGDGEFGDNYSGGNADRELLVNGAVIAEYFTLARSLPGGQNMTDPAEIFNIPPYAYIALSPWFGESAVLWREISP